MQAARYILLTVLLATEFFLGAALFCPRLVDDWRYASALSNHHRNPTQETKATQEREGARVRRELVLVDLATACLLVLNTFLLRLTVRRILKRHSQPSLSPASP